MPTLTKRQKQIYDFIEQQINKKGFSPTITEIKKHFKLKALSGIHQHVDALISKGFLKRNENQARGLELIDNESMIQIPLAGTITAGQPIEAIEVPDETITVTKDEIGKFGRHYALRVVGNSMIDDGIYDGDVVIIKQQSTANNGETVVAIINENEATLKKIYREKNRFRLQPANPTLFPIYTKELEVRGVVVKIIRNFEKPKKIKHNTEFTQETFKYIEETDLRQRKALGQYFTPKSVREALLKQLPKTKSNPRVLDPGCGTGEFLITAQEYFKNPELFGWDIDPKLGNISKKLVPSAEIRKLDSLKKEYYEQFDFVIGNPPYFEFKPEDRIKEKFKEVINGRINIFSLFIYQSLKWLKTGGYLAFVVPPSMNNGAYFQKLRNFIIENSNIEYLHVFDNSKLFHNALQSTMLLVLKKGKNKGDYIFKKNGILIFSEKPDQLKKAFKGKLTLRDLGWQVKTGRVVWNQNKELLTDKAQGNIPLIWAHNITEQGLKVPVKNLKKPQYIKYESYDMGPAIVVNRITGSVKAAKLKASVVPKGMKFLGENHVNVIYPPAQQKEIEFKNKKNIKLTLQNIALQLSSTKKLEVIQNITGNTQISKTELENLFPLDVD